MTILCPNLFFHLEIFNIRVNNQGQRVQPVNKTAYKQHFFIFLSWFDIFYVILINLYNYQPSSQFHKIIWCEYMFLFLIDLILTIYPLNVAYKGERHQGNNQTRKQSFFIRNVFSTSLCHLQELGWYGHVSTFKSLWTNRNQNYMYSYTVDHFILVKYIMFINMVHDVISII